MLSQQDVISVKQSTGIRLPMPSEVKKAQAQLNVSEAFAFCAVWCELIEKEKTSRSKKRKKSLQ